MNNDSLDMLLKAYDALEDKLGEEIKIIDIRGISVLADYFVVAHGNNKNHIQALVDRTEEFINKAGYETVAIEGVGDETWVLMDFGGIIVHVFHKDQRLFYDLERIWSDGKLLSIEEVRNNVNE